MPSQPSTDLTLRAENAALRVRLEEAEQMLRAIRAGELSALVVEGDADPRLQTLQGLEAEQNRLRGEMLAQVTDAVIAVDAEERITYLNAAAERLYGVRAGDVLGRTPTEIFTAHWPSPEAEAGMRTALSERGEWRGALIHRRPDGSDMRVESSIAILHDPETGERNGLIAAIRDITERNETDERLRLAIAGADMGTWHWDIRTGALDWSERCLTIFGIPPRTAMSYEKFLGALHPEDRARTDDAVRHALQNGSEYRIEFRSVWPDGSVHWAVSLGRAYHDAAGEPARMEGIALDITERKRAEEARHESERNYRALVTASSEVLYRMNADWSEMHQLDGQDFIVDTVAPSGNWVEEYLYPEDQPQVLAVIREAIRTKSHFEMEHRVRRVDGRVRWTFSRAIPLLDAKGEIAEWFGAASDVTARKQAEAALQLTNERLTLAVECSQVVLFQQDLELRYTWLHNAVPSFYGAHGIGKRDADLVERAEDAVLTEALKREVIRSGVGVRQEVLVHIQNAARYYDLLVEPLRDAAGLISGITCAAIDITERKQMEEARQESKDHLRYALQAAKAGAWDWNIRSGEVAWSPENYALYDIDPAQGPLHYEDWKSRLHPEDRDRVNEHVRAVLDGREAEFRTEFRIVNRQGAVRWLLGLGRVERDRDGQTPSLSGLYMDITDRKHSEAALRETERNYRALADASLEIAYRMSADWSTMLPLDGRELVASSDQPLAEWAWLDQNLPRDEHARVRLAIEDAIARKALFELEHRVQRRDGSLGWVFSRAVPILDENAGLIAWFGAASDITERKRIELNLTHAIAVAEKASRAKSDFLSSMSHELRTPLNAILGFAQLMESGTPAPTPAQTRSLDQILKGGWYLLDLINELLDLAQIESGNLSLTQEPVSLAEVMLECQAMFEPQARKRGIGITFPSFEVSGYVRADRTRVKQVVINLLSNAIKYNKVQGAVAVEWTLSLPEVIRISVRDTGEGLAPEKLAQLFQPFNRLGQEVGPQVGTGIGLVMTKRLIELMGGTIGADSKVGVGSVFWFELKQASAPQSALLLQVEASGAGVA